MAFAINPWMTALLASVRGEIAVEQLYEIGGLTDPKDDNFGNYPDNVPDFRWLSRRQGLR